MIKSRKPEFKSIAVEPANSPVITQTKAGEPLKPGKHTIQGIGAGFIPDVLNVDIIDEVVLVKDEDAAETARQLSTKEGLFCGISGGAATWAALEVARRSSERGKTDCRRAPRPWRALPVHKALSGINNASQSSSSRSWANTV